MSPSEAYTMMKLAGKCNREGHRLTRTGNPDVHAGFVLVCHTCKIAYDMPTADQLFEQLSRQEIENLMEETGGT